MFFVPLSLNAQCKVRKACAGFDQDQNEAAQCWQMTGKAQLCSRHSRLERKHTESLDSYRVSSAACVEYSTSVQSLTTYS